MVSSGEEREPRRELRPGTHPSKPTLRHVLSDAIPERYVSKPKPSLVPSDMLAGRVYAFAGMRRNRVYHGVWRAAHVAFDRGQINVLRYKQPTLTLCVSCVSVFAIASLVPREQSVGSRDPRRLSNGSRDPGHWSGHLRHKADGQDVITDGWISCALTATSAWTLRWRAPGCSLAQPPRGLFVLVSTKASKHGLPLVVWRTTHRPIYRPVWPHLCLVLAPSALLRKSLSIGPTAISHLGFFISFRGPMYSPPPLVH